jgi:hypothetical protein
MSGTRSIESRQLCRAVPDAVSELEEAWRLNDAHPHVAYAHPGTVGAAARLPKAPGSQNRLSEDLSSVRMMRASMPAAIVATQSARHRSPVVERRPNGSGPNRCEEVPEMSQRRLLIVHQEKMLVSAASDYVDRIVHGRRQLSQIASQTDCALCEQEGL